VDKIKERFKGGDFEQRLKEGNLTIEALRKK